MTQITDQLRMESDSLGQQTLPQDCLYGISTLRGSENFKISGKCLGDEPVFIEALAAVKRAAALANKNIGALSPEQADAIVAASDEVIQGEHARHFVIDLMEGSGGTSINMNVNEVLANRGLQILGYETGSYDQLHPNDHVNRSQSTNDVVPTALKLTVHRKTEPLLVTLASLSGILQEKSKEFDDVLRIGRTCMQAAQPMTLGQAFGGYASVVARIEANLRRLNDDLLVVPLGGTAIGTGLGCWPGFREAVIDELAKWLGKPVQMAEDVFDGMQNADAFARHSSELRIAGDIVAKIASDLILLSSGPNSGLGEIVLPAVQAGSSIMPGKINPVMPMMMQQVAFAVTGNDLAVSMAALQGQLEINHFEPVMASRLFDSIGLLTGSIGLFTEKCIAGIQANRERSMKNLMDSSALASVFLPTLGYEKTTKIVKQGVAENKPFIRSAVDLGLLSNDQVLQMIHDSTGYKSQKTA